MTDTRLDAVIVGAGLAGLACALELQEAGCRIALFEEAPSVGGRMRTDLVDGFRLDRGFQVLLDSYPEVGRHYDPAALRVGAFEPGAMIWTGRRLVRITDPWRRPRTLLSTIGSRVASLGDLTLLRRLLSECREETGEESEGELNTARFLATYGFSKNLLERFLIPFFTGVFLARDLEVPASRFRYFLGMFAEGTAVLPADGIEAFPRLLASKLHDGVLQLSTRVTRVEDGEIEIEGGRKIAARAVIVATDGISAAELLLGRKPVRMRGAVTLYFTAGRACVGKPYLVLNGSGRGVVNHLSELSTIQPAYAPEGRTLLSVSVLPVDAPNDDESLERLVRSELKGWFGSKVDRWELLRVYRVPFALPVMDRVSCPIRPPGSVRTYLCGDYTVQPSIQGAMSSGVKTARKVLERFQAASSLTGPPATPVEKGVKRTLTKRADTP